jgi:hypothetical protein
MICIIGLCLEACCIPTRPSNLVHLSKCAPLHELLGIAVVKLQCQHVQINTADSLFLVFVTG